MLNVALLRHLNGSVLSNKQVCCRLRSSAAPQRKPILCSLICGLMLFCLGMILLSPGILRLISSGALSDLGNKVSVSNWMYMGHKRTIRPNAKRLSRLLTERDQMDWDTFVGKVKAVQRGFMGEPDEMRPGRGEFHEYPYSCICEKPPGDIVDDDNNSGDPQSEQIKRESKIKEAKQ